MGKDVYTRPSGVEGFAYLVWSDDYCRKLAAEGRSIMGMCGDRDVTPFPDPNKDAADDYPEGTCQ